MLAAESLEFHYRGGQPVLRRVSACFEPGRVTALLGPNGSGKSTLLRLLAGVLTPVVGRVTLEGGAVGGMPERQRARRIAYIPQHTALAFPFTVRQFVRLGLHTAAAQSWRAEEALAAAGIAGRADEPLMNLSAGQRQRASFARALAQLAAMPKPGVLLADEPTSAMDPRHALEAVEILRQRAAVGHAVVVVLHDLTLAGRCADDVVLLDEHGTVAARGSKEAVLEPAVLGRVFNVDFVELRSEGGPSAMVPVLPRASDVRR